MRTKFVAMTLAVLSFSLLLSSVIHAGGKKRKKGDPKDDPSVFYFDDDMADAEDTAAEEKKPIMMVVCNSYAPEDYKPVERMITWPYAIVGSHKDYVATRDTVKNPELKALCEKMHVKTLPAIIWMDSYGNPVSLQSFPEAAPQIQSVAQNWPALSAKVEKFFKDHIDRGDKYVKMNHSKEGYNEYAFVAPFKGPLPERARDSQKKVKDQWNKLLSVARSSPPKERTLILQGIQRETSGTNLEREMLAAVTEALNAAGDKPVKSVASATPETEKPAATDATPPTGPGEANAGKTDEPKVAAAPTAPPAAPAPNAPPAPPAPPTPEKLLETKSLGDLASTSSAAPVIVETDDSSVGAVLLNKADPKLKEAHGLIQTAATSYRKAIADSTERGPARNEMLKTAYQNLSKAMDILDAATSAKPDAQLDKVSQDISMMMYGCLKYQSL